MILCLIFRPRSTLAKKRFVFGGKESFFVRNGPNGPKMVPDDQKGNMASNACTDESLEINGSVFMKVTGIFL